MVDFAKSSPELARGRANVPAVLRFASAELKEVVEELNGVANPLSRASAVEAGSAERRQDAVSPDLQHLR